MKTINIQDTPNKVLFSNGIELKIYITVHNTSCAAQCITSELKKHNQIEMYRSGS